jgi:hypothetical protein
VTAPLIHNGGLVLDSNTLGNSATLPPRPTVRARWLLLLRRIGGALDAARHSIGDGASATCRELEECKQLVLNVFKLGLGGVPGGRSPVKRRPGRLADGLGPSLWSHAPVDSIPPWH